MTSLIYSGKTHRGIDFRKKRGFSLFYLDILHVFVWNLNLRNTKVSVFPEVEKSLVTFNSFYFLAGSSNVF